MPPQPAPDFTVLNTRSEPVALSTLWSVRLTALVFVRHLGCTFCKEQVKDLRDHAVELAQAGLGVAVITPDTVEHNAAFAAEYALPFLVLADPERSVYAAYGFQEGTFGQLLNPHVVARGAVATLRGNIAGRSAGNARQLPGLALVDRAGLLRYRRPARDAADHLSARQLLAVARPLLRTERERTRPDAAE
jgi:peroxiredoxin